MPATIYNIKLSIFLSLGLIFFFLSSATFASGQTVIYIVRHAEKDLRNPSDNNPNLSQEGRERVEALNKLLRRESISAVFSTKYNRTMQTVAPVAQRNGTPVQTYIEANKEFADMVKTEFANKKILISGHSNTVPGLVKSFGLIPPMDALTDEDYDLLFIITFDKKGKATLKIEQYGKVHHQTALPGLK